MSSNSSILPQNLGYKSCVKLAGNVIFCTGGSIVESPKYLNSTGGFGTLDYNVGVPIKQRIQTSVNLSCQLCANSSSAMLGCFNDQQAETNVDINGRSNDFYWNSFSASASQGSFVTGSFGFISNKQLTTRSGTNSSNSSKSGNSSNLSDKKNPIPYYGSTAPTGCVGWNFSVSQPVNFKMLCDANNSYYVVFGIRNAQVTLTQISLPGTDDVAIAITCGGSTFIFSKCKVNSITPNVVGTNNFQLYDVNYISYQCGDSNSGSGSTSS